MFTDYASAVNLGLSPDVLLRLEESVGHSLKLTPLDEFIHEVREVWSKPGPIGTPGPIAP